MYKYNLYIKKIFYTLKKIFFEKKKFFLHFWPKMRIFGSEQSGNFF